MLPLRRLAACAIFLSALPACGSSGGSHASSVDAGFDAGDPSTFAAYPKSCAYACPDVATCAEETSPYVCPSVGAWARIPHAPSCLAWDGGAPAAHEGECTVSLATGEAAKYAGPDPGAPGTVILPDGRRLAPAGSDWVFDESDLQGGLTTFLGAIPGTPYVVTVDDGAVDHVVRVIDPARIGSGDTPVTGYVSSATDTLNSAAAFVAPSTLYVATDDGVVRAFTVDTSTGALTESDDLSIMLPAGQTMTGGAGPWYVAGLAASPDGKRLVVTGVFSSSLLVYDVDPRSKTRGMLAGQVGLGGAETFQVSFDPNDPAAQYAYVSMWGSAKVVQVDVSNAASPAVSHTYATGKDPEGVAFLDARWMVVADDLGDTLSVVDRTSGSVTSVPVDATQPLHGAEPSALAFDASTKRLYATLSGRNAVAAFDVDVTQTPPALTPAGLLASGYQPSGIVVQSDGSLVVSEMRGHGTGPRPAYFTIGNSDIDALMRGGVQHIPAPSAADLAAGASAVTAADAPGAEPGAPVVTCPAGAHDFPVPITNTGAPSPTIEHVVFIVRENKGFDGLFGDLPTANGDPAYLLKQSTVDMNGIWHNLRDLAKAFAVSDNYYTDAIYSTQGHTWTTYGRPNDFDERTWAVSGSGRSARAAPESGIASVGQPLEGSLFDWLGQNSVPYDLLGEIVGAPQVDSEVPPAIDGRYPGGPIQNIGSNDLDKACYTAGRLRVLCDLRSFVYMTLPNDHTFGVSPTNPTPEVFCAVNDEATGMMIDAVSHSPLWASTLVVITEDDPSQGGEHVDSHRAPVVFISPWVKRGAVSHQHIDAASLHHLFAHLFAKPYLNADVAAAPLPLDLFTSTPDYSPYTYAPRTWPLGCDAAATEQERQTAAGWDLSEPDEQPGLDRQVTEYLMRGRPSGSMSP